MNSYGIDFGTTKSAIAITNHKGEPMVVPIKDEAKLEQLSTWAIPSQVLVRKKESDKPFFIRFETFFDKEITEVSVKRVKEEVWSRSEGIKQFFPDMLKLKLGNPKGFEGEDVGDLKEIRKNCKVEIRPEGLAAVIMRHLKDKADAKYRHIEKNSRLKGSVRWINRSKDVIVEAIDRIIRRDKVETVVGVPADFRYRQRKALVYAAHLAGFDTAMLLEEPVAATLSLKDKFRNCQIMTIDFGGGTCHYAVFSIDDEGKITLVYADCARVGGEHITDDLLKVVKPDDLGPYEKWLLRGAIDACKMEFIWPSVSAYDGTEDESSPSALIKIGPRISLPDETGIQPKPITNAKFHEIVKKRVLEVRNHIYDSTQARQDAWLRPLDAIVFMGGSSRLYCFEEILWHGWLRDIAGKGRPQPFQVYRLPSANVRTQVNNASLLPDATQAIVKGAAQFCAALNRGELLYEFKTGSTITISLKKWNGEVLGHTLPDDQRKVEEGSDLPLQRTLRFQILEKVSRGFKIEFHFSDEPDEPADIFVIKPKREADSIPKKAFVWITYKVRRDQLIEIVGCIVRPEPFSMLTFLGQRLVGSKEIHDEQPIALSIPLHWETELHFADWFNEETIDKNINFYNLRETKYMDTVSEEAPDIQAHSIDGH